MSKGSRPRPLSVDRKTLDDNYDRIFGKPERHNGQHDESKQGERTTERPSFEASVKSTN